MANASDAAKAEQLTRRRAGRFPRSRWCCWRSKPPTYRAPAPVPARETVDHVQIGAWLILSVVLLLALATGGGWIYSRQVRDLANDEATRAHQADAFRVGFIVAMAGAIALYVVSLFEPLGGRDAIHLILSFGLASALLRFGMLERRAQSDG